MKKNSKQKTNQVDKDFQNENHEEFNIDEIDEDNMNICHLTNTELDSFKNNFQLFRSNDHNFGNEVDVLRNGVHKLINSVHNFSDDFNGLRNDVHGLRNDVYGLRNDIHGLRNDIHGLSNDVHGLSNDVHGLRNDIHEFSNNFENLFNEINAILNRNPNEMSNSNKGQNNNINYDELLEEKELDEEIFEKYESEKCAICLEEFNIGNKVCYLPCFHIYHSFCIKNWLKIRGKCPLCGKDLNK